MSALPGIGGSLFPNRYLSEALLPAAPAPEFADLERRRRQFQSWWRRVEAMCGPATGIAALFDVVAMPLAGMLGFRARDVARDRRRMSARLETRHGTPVALVVLPWASQPSGIWRELASLASGIDARWGFAVAPPFASLVQATGCVIRRSVDFSLPDVFDARSFPCFWQLAEAAAFDAGAGRHSSRLERLVAESAGFQDRVRRDLQDGVVDALHAIGEALARRRKESAATSFDEALTIVYRILFLLFAESRDLVPRTATVYRGAYAVGTLCREAIGGSQTVGFWDGLGAITRLSRIGCRTADLIVKPFNGPLFARDRAPSLEPARVLRAPTRISAERDRALVRALVALGSRRGAAGREEIAYGDLGVEQLGAVYERVLDLDLDPGGLRPARLQMPAPARGRHSHRRKQTGTFYTPQPLAEFLVRRTLAPLVAGASADRILSLRVVDPAMGSGAFLVAACRYLAGAYEQALVDEGRAVLTDFNEEERTKIRRLVAERCLAGVDVNPTAVELARLSMWLTTLAAGKPLSFLDHRLRVGNSLVGATPSDLSRGPGVRLARSDVQLPLFDERELEQTMARVARPLSEIASRHDDTVDVVRAKEAVWNALVSRTSPLEPWRLACTLWCARWFWPSGTPPSPAELRAAIDAILKGDSMLRPEQLAALTDAARDAQQRHHFFHWPLEFADVFYDSTGRERPDAGFDAVIGNPPWEMLRNEPGARDGSMSGTRTGFITHVGAGFSRPDQDNAPGHETGSRHMTLGTRTSLVRFIRESGLYPSCDRGHVNLYQPFLERAIGLVRRGGRVGMILPWGFAADDGAAKLRGRLLERRAIHTIVGIDNARGIFPIHRGVRFLVLVASPGQPVARTRGRFGVTSAAELDELPGRDESIDGSPFPIALTPEVVRRMGGAARRIPDVRKKVDLELLERLTAAHPALGSTDGWNVHFGRELNATEDRSHFGGSGLPVLEGKHISPFVVDLGAAAHRIAADRAERVLGTRAFTRPRLAYRDVSGVANRLSLIAAIVPPGAVTTHTLFCLRGELAVERQYFLCGLFNSFVLNAVVRMLMGGHLTTSLVEGLPAPVWTGAADQHRIAELARQLSTHSSSRRASAQLQAAVARLYGLDAAAFARVLDGFPLVPADDRHAALEEFRLT